MLYNQLKKILIIYKLKLVTKINIMIILKYNWIMIKYMITILEKNIKNNIHYMEIINKISFKINVYLDYKWIIILIINIHILYYIIKFNKNYKILHILIINKLNIMKCLWIRKVNYILI